MKRSETLSGCKNDLILLVNVVLMSCNFYRATTIGFNTLFNFYWSSGNKSTATSSYLTSVIALSFLYSLRIVIVNQTIDIKNNKIKIQKVKLTATESQSSN